MIKQVHRTRLSDLSRFAQQIAKNITGGAVLALIGPLGSGKTTFTKLLAKQLGIRKKITSPTFALVQSYSMPKKSLLSYLHHMDLYRTESNKEVVALGLSDLFLDKKSIIIIEWGNKIKSLLPTKTIFIHFKK